VSAMFTVHAAAKRRLQSGPTKDQNTAVVTTAVVTLTLLLLLWSFILSFLYRSFGRWSITDSSK
jgi:hypothetical protein